MSTNFQELADTLYWEKVERAQRMKPEERMAEGVRMFDRECEAMRLEILQMNPAFSEADVAKEIRRRLDEAGAYDDATHYRPDSAQTNLQ